MKKGDLVIVRSDIPSGARVGGVLFTTKYHVPLRNEMFTLNRQTSNGNWYYEEGDTSVVFSEEMLINLSLSSCDNIKALNTENYEVDCGSVYVHNANDIISTVTKITDITEDLNLITNKEYENKLQGKETADSGRGRREGSSVYGRRNKATIAIRHLSYKARYGKS